MMRKKQLWSSLLLLLAAVIWGFTFSAQKKGMDFLGPVSFHAWRALLGGLSLLPLLLWKKEKTPVSVPAKLIWLGGLSCGGCMLAGCILQQWSMLYIQVGETGFLTALYIILVPLAEIFLKHRIPLFLWIAIIPALTGSYFLCTPEGTDWWTNPGYGLAIAGAFAFTGHFICISHFVARVPAIHISVIQLLTNGVGAFIIAAAAGDSWTWRQVADGLPYILLAGILSCGVGFSLQVAAQKNVPPTVTTLIVSLESVFAAIGGWLFLGESMTSRTLSGGGLIFGAVILAQLPAAKGNDIDQPVTENYIISEKSSTQGAKHG